jgi:hypothetical protein
MVQTKMGRYWEQAKGWFFLKVWSFKTKERLQTKIPEMRPTCQSHTDEQSRKRRVLSNEREQPVILEAKPTNVATFAKRKKAADGGMIKQAQQNYRGSYISGDLGGVEVSNPSLKKYYKGML